MGEIVKKNCGVEFFQLGNFNFFFKFKQNLLCIFFFRFSLCLLLYVTKALVFKVDAIDGKKWVKFVAMRQDRATLIYDLNTVKGTVKSYLKKIAPPFKPEQFQA